MPSTKKDVTLVEAKETSFYKLSLL
jgi:hypothetical protein